MFKNHVYGIDLGSNMIKIYSQNSNEILKEKNMIAIRNKDTVLAVGDEAYEIYEKNPTNVKVSSPMLNGMIANISHLEIMLQLAAGQDRTQRWAAPGDLFCCSGRYDRDRKACILQYRPYRTAQTK